jgi:hypothetical protein
MAFYPKIKAARRQNGNFIPLGPSSVWKVYTNDIPRLGRAALLSCYIEFEDEPREDLPLHSSVYG